MTKTPYIKVVQRINTALILLRKNISPARAGKLLARRYGISGRQAYRYILQAQASGKPLPIPERKVVFTVKLPLSLVQRLRQRVRLRGESLSAMVTDALEYFLKRVKNAQKTAS